MDIEGAVRAVEALRQTMEPEEQKIIDAEMCRLGVVSEAAGSIAAAEEAETAEIEFEEQLENFLNPTIAIEAEQQVGAKQQLELMKSFWARLGYQVPALDTEQRAEELEEAIAENPHLRIIPHPLLNHEGHCGIAEAAKTYFRRNQFDPDYHPLWAPDTGELYGYGELIIDPDNVIESDKRYSMGYQYGDAVIIGQREWAEAMIEAGKAVEAEDGTVWLFPVTDVRSKSERIYDETGKPREEDTQGALIARQLLYQANGTPNSDRVDFATNEAVYELYENGDKKLQCLVSVRWDPVDLRVILQLRYPDKWHDPLLGAKDETYPQVTE
ncbi:hypothetical protein KY385_03930 [Candidatus Parcubacteria bacterium]|nr:hypothetical protein [Candidatus Parcubacteria bacterium]